MEWVASGGLALLTGWSGYAFGRRQERDRERRGRALAAAEGMASPLRNLQVLIRRFGRTSVTNSEVASAFMAWSSAYDAYSHRIPGRWRHLSRSVRDAAGTVFGGIAFVDLRPDSADIELAEPDWMWQDFADEYPDYCVSVLLRWGESNLKRSTHLKDYDRWLVDTGRREPPGSNSSPTQLAPTPTGPAV